MSGSRRGALGDSRKRDCHLSHGILFGTPSAFVSVSFLLNVLNGELSRRGRTGAPDVAHEETEVR